MAAGSWYTSSGLGDANIAVAQRAIQSALNASDKNRQIIAHPVFMQMLMADTGIGPLIGALGYSMGLLTHGTGKMSANAEGNATTATNYSSSNTTTITPARHTFGRIASDWARAVQEALLRGDLAPSHYAMLIVEGYKLWSNTYVDKVAALFPSLSTEIGLTGTDLNWTAMHHGIIDFRNAGNSGPMIALIDNVGAKQLMDDTVSLGGAIQFSQNAQDSIQGAAGGAYLGQPIRGVDFYMCGELDLDGSDRCGALFTAGCMQSKHTRVALPAEADLVADGGWYNIEAIRLNNGTTQFNTVSHLAVQIQEQARGAMIRYSST